MQRKGKNTDKFKSDAQKIPVGFHMEADKLGNKLSLSIMGALSILDFSESSALVKSRKGKIKINGEELSVAVYENKTVEIFGKICSVEFL